MAQKYHRLSAAEKKILFRIYQWCGAVIYPFVGAVLRIRAKYGKEDRDRRTERYGYPSQKKPEGPILWMHAASVGELIALLPLVKRAKAFNINVLVTTATVTAAKIAEEKIAEDAIHQYMPLDITKAVNRFLNHWNPDLVIFAESELWPNIMTEIARRKIAHLIVNARMSDRSNNLWSKRPKLAKNIFSNITQVIAQSELDGERFKNLGAPWVTVAGNLKADAETPSCDPQELYEIQQNIGQRPVWVAVSTHAKEEEAMAEVHKTVKQYIPNILTVIVPRHARRSEQITEELEEMELNVVRKSTGEAISEITDIYLGDTMGEIGLYLRLGKIAFLGKSLKAQGGQNPIEPAMLGVAVLSGRHVQNFREIYRKLINDGGARIIKNENYLAAHIIHLVKNEKEMNAMRYNAKMSVNNMKGAFELTAKILDEHLMPLRVKASLTEERQHIQTSLENHNENS